MLPRVTVKWLMLPVGRRERIGRSVIGVAAAAGLVTLGLPAMSTAAAAGSTPAPLRLAADGALAGQYIVVLKDPGAMRASGLRDASSGAIVEGAVSRGRKLGAVVGRTYTQALRGYSARLTAAQVGAVRNDPQVAYVQQDQTYRTTSTGRDWTAASFAPAATSVSGTQSSPAWGLDRIDQRSNTRNGKYYFTDTGAGVTAYVVDTGIYAQHLDFTTDRNGHTVPSRVSGGVDLVKDGRGTGDCVGHGTHVAGTIGGTVFGVAKDAKLVPVRVLACNGESSSSTVAAGLDWIVAHRSTGPAVANLSLSNEGGSDSVVEKAVERLIAAGVTTVIAAGNGDADGNGMNACDVSPGRTKNAITVGASSRGDKRAGFSNFGACVDLYAPGVGVQSDWYTGDDVTAVLDGTSMATPHVAGAAALYLEKHPRAAPATVQSAVKAATTKGVIGNVSTKWAHNLLFAVQPVTAPQATTTAGQIPSGQALLKGSKVCSPNGLYCLSQQASDGKLALLRPGGRALFNSGKGAAWTIMRAGGNLVSQNAYGQSVWSSGSTDGPSTLKVLDNGTAVITRNGTGAVTWTSNAAQHVAPKQVASLTAKLDRTVALYRAGVKMQSANGKYQLIFRTSGDLVLWKVKQGQIWHTGVKNADWLGVTTNGNLVLWRSDGAVGWSTKTAGSGATKLTVQDNGDLTLRRVSDNKIVWQSHTAGK
jgi:subtilisin family serine protease